MDTDTLIRQLMDLPSEQQQEVAAFVATLCDRLGPHGGTPAAASGGSDAGCLVDEPFVGIWQGRKDMGDGARWVRGVRRAEWGA